MLNLDIEKIVLHECIFSLINNKLRSLFLKKEIQFPLNNLNLLWLGVWVAYIKTQLGIATQVSVITVKVTVTENRNSVFAQ